MIRACAVAAPLFLVALVGCNGNNDLPKGCINVDDDGDFDTVAEAVEAATAGQTVFLCEADFAETLTIDKDLTLEGAASDDTFWAGLGDEVPLRITGANVTLRRIGFQSEASGVVIEGGSLDLDRVAFWGVGEFGVQASDAAVTASRVKVSNAGEGGFEVVDGSLDLVDSEVVARGNGVKVEGGTAHIAGTEFSGIFPMDGSDLGEGGWGVWLDGAAGELEGNTFTQNAADVYVEGAGGTVSMLGDALSGSYYGVWFESTSGSLTDVTIDQYLQYGIIQNGGQSLELTNVTITTDPDVSAPQEPGDYEGFSGSVGIIAFGADVTFTGGEVSGNNGGGIYQADQVGPAQFVASDLLVDDNARFGIFTSAAEATFTDVVISNTRDDDASCVQEVGYYKSFNCNAGLWSAYSQVSWTGGSLSNGGALGATVLGDTLALSDVTFDHPGNYGIWAIQSAITTDAVTFESTAEIGLLLQQDAVGVIQNSVFRNGSFAVDYPLDEVTTYRYYYYGQDVQVYQSTLIVENSKFENGDNGVSLYEGTAEITGSSWDGYNSDALYASYDAALVVTDSTFTNVGNDAISCYSGIVQLDGVSITGVTQEVSKSERYDNGELLEDQSFEYSFVGEAMYLSACEVIADDVTVKNSTGPAFYGRDSSIELDGAVFTDVGRTDSSYDAGLYLTWSADAPNVSISNLTVSGVTYGDAVRLVGNGIAGSVTLDGVSIGKDVDGVSGVQANGIALQNLGGSSVISGFEIEGVGSAGIVLENSPALLESGVIRDAGTDGIVASGAEIEVSDVVVEGATQSGIHFTDSATHTVRDSTVTGTEYGIECDADPAATVLECDTNTLTGATADFLACGGCTP